MRFVLWALLAALLLPSDAMAETNRIDIIAVVNGDSITNYDLQDRMRMTMQSSGLPDSPELRSKLKLATLQTLVNEILQKKEAERLGVQVTDKDIERAFRELEKKNNIPEGKFDDVLKQQGVKKEVVVNQIKSQMLWRKVLGKKFPNTIVPESDVQEALGQIEETPENVSYSLAEIALPKTAEGNSDNAGLAKKLVDELRGGADFAKVAEQFSTSGSASRGGQIGWLKERQLSDKIRPAIAKIPEGGVTDPIKTDDGYLIFKVVQKEVQGGKVTPEKAREIVTMRKMELDARQYMQELREKAFIEVRL